MIIYRCDKCKSDHKEPEALTTVTSAEGDLTVDLCDACFERVMMYQPPPGQTRWERNGNGYSDGFGCATIPLPNLPSTPLQPASDPEEPRVARPDRSPQMKQTQINLTGIAPEDRNNFTE